MRFHSFLAIWSLALLCCMMPREAGATIPDLHTTSTTSHSLGSVDHGGTSSGRIALDGDETEVQGKWDERFGPPGTDGTVYTVAVMGGDTYIGGDFIHIGNLVVNHIARWDGHAWHALGNGFNAGLDGSVSCLLVDGDSLFVGGRFDYAANLQTTNVAIWHPAQQVWSRLGIGFTGSDYSALAAVVRSGDYLYTGGNFSAAPKILANNVARSDGVRWQRFSSGVNGSVNAIAVIGTHVYVGGKFSTAGSAPAQNIAMWDVALGTWSTLSGGVSSDVYGFAVHGNDLYVAGRFARAGTLGVPGLAVWNDASQSWASSQVPIYSGILAVAADDENLYLAGSFQLNINTQSGAGKAWGVLRWNFARKTVDQLAGTLQELDNKAPFGQALAVSGGMLYLGGGFPLAGFYEAQNVAACRLSDMRWISLGDGVNGTSAGTSTTTKSRPRYGLRAVATAGNDLYIGGYFSSVGGVPTYNIARWDGTQWHGLGDGVGSGIPNSTEFFAPEGVLAIAVRGTDLFVAGEFESASGVQVHNLARWDGSRWSPAGPLSGTVDMKTFAVVGGDLYAVGTLGSVSGLFRWTGTDWTAIGDEFAGSVESLATDGHDLYIGGNFSSANGVQTSGVVRYDPAGGTWSAIGEGLRGEAKTLLFSRGRLYAGGRFVEAGGNTVIGAAAWNGELWQILGDGVGGDGDSVNALALIGDDLYIGGNFSSANGAAANFLAMWNGSSWHQVGSGMDYGVTGLAAQGSDLYVCGDFTYTGDVQSHYLARWSKTADAEVKGVDAITGPGTAITGIVPNPATDQIEIAIRLSHACSGTIAVYDGLGRQLSIVGSGNFEAGSQVFHWSVAEIPDGSYFCRFVTTDGASMVRMTVIHH